MKALDLADTAKISYRQLDYWVRCGHLKPDKAFPGSGYHRLLNDTEVAVCLRMATLVRVGLLPGPAATLARWMVDHGSDTVRVDADGALVTLVVAGHDASDAVEAS